MTSRADKFYIILTKDTVKTRELPHENFIMSLYFYFGLGLFLLVQAYWIFTKLRQIFALNRQMETKETRERIETSWESIKQICLVYFISCVLTIYMFIRFDGDFCPVFLMVLFN